MMNQLEGLFLSAFPYTDNSTIIHLFMKDYGRRTFIFKGLRKKNSPFIFQPMHFIEFQSTFKVEKSINSGTKQTLVFPCHQITSDIRKTSVALFLTDILNNLLKEGDYSDELYPFLKNSFLLFEIQEYNVNFHLLFLIHLLDFLGIGPKKNYSSTNTFFNIEKAMFTSKKEDFSMDFEDSLLFYKILGTTIDNETEINVSKSSRNKLLEMIFQYLEFHFHFDSKKISSHSILKTIFS